MWFVLSDSIDGYTSIIGKLQLLSRSENREGKGVGEVQALNLSETSPRLLFYSFSTLLVVTKGI